MNAGGEGKRQQPPGVPSQRTLNTSRVYDQPVVSKGVSETEFEELRAQKEILKKAVKEYQFRESRLYEQNDEKQRKLDRVLVDIKRLQCENHDLQDQLTELHREFESSKGIATISEPRQKYTPSALSAVYRKLTLSVGTDNGAPAPSTSAALKSPTKASLTRPMRPTRTSIEGLLKHDPETGAIEYPPPSPLPRDYDELKDLYLRVAHDIEQMQLENSHLQMQLKSTRKGDGFGENGQRLYQRGPAISESDSDVSRRTSYHRSDRSAPVSATSRTGNMLPPPVIAGPLNLTSAKSGGSKSPHSSLSLAQLEQAETPQSVKSPDSPGSPLPALRLPSSTRRAHHEKHMSWSSPATAQPIASSSLLHSMTRSGASEDNLAAIRQELKRMADEGESWTRWLQEIMDEFSPESAHGSVDGMKTAVSTLLRSGQDRLVQLEHMENTRSKLEEMYLEASAKSDVNQARLEEAERRNALQVEFYDNKVRESENTLRELRETVSDYEKRVNMLQKQNEHLQGEE